MSNSDFNRNGQPNFGPFGPLTVDPHTTTSPQPREPISIPANRDPSNITGQPPLSSPDMPASRPSPAVKPGR